MNRMKHWLICWVRGIWNRKGGSTIEYVIVIAAAALLVSFLYAVITSNQTKSTIEQKVSDALQGKAHVGQGGSVGTPSSGNGTGSGGSPSSGGKPSTGDSHKPPAKPQPKKDQDLVDGMINYFTSGQALKDTKHIVKETADFLILDDVSGCFTGKDADGQAVSGFDQFVSCASLVPVAKPLKALKYGDEAAAFVKKLDDKLMDTKLGKKLQAGKKKADDVVDNGKRKFNCACYTNEKTRQHVHEGEIATSPQSLYYGKWNGDGLHNWNKMKKRVKQDGYEFDEILLDPNTGVRKVKIKMNTLDPAKARKYQQIKQLLDAQKNGTLSKKKQKMLNKYTADEIQEVESKSLQEYAKVDPPSVVEKTVYPEHYTEAEIDDIGEQALAQYLINNPKLPYKNPKGKVEQVKFSSVVKGPDGKTIEVEGYVVPKPDGTVDHIVTHYPKFNSTNPQVLNPKNP